MPKLPPLTPKKLLSILQKKGFEVDHVTGSHHVLYNPMSKLRVTVPLHKKDLPKGTLHTILKSAGISHSDLRD